MRKHIWLMTMLATVTLLGADFGKNIYKNSSYEQVKTSKGDTRIRDHWYTGKLVREGMYQGHPAVMLTAEKTSWGRHNAVLATNAQKLPPGTYCFSVWCNIQQKDLKDIRFLELIKRSTVNGKQVNVVKKYDRSQLPKADIWIELVENFDIKPQEEKVFFLCRQYADGPATVSYAHPQLVKNNP